MIQHAILRHAVQVECLQDVPRAGHPAENIYESYCCVQILMIPSVDFIERTATFGSTDFSVPHDLNEYTRCVGWRFIVCHHEKSQLFETILIYLAVDLPHFLLWLYGTRNVIVKFSFGLFSRYYVPAYFHFNFYPSM